jgi:hypothetical protein
MITDLANPKVLTNSLASAHSKITITSDLHSHAQKARVRANRKAAIIADLLPLKLLQSSALLRDVPSKKVIAADHISHFQMVNQTNLRINVGHLPLRFLQSSVLSKVMVTADLSPAQKVRVKANRKAAIIADLLPLKFLQRSAQ